MPNIIEQQDLLKGLPDARLASLMQTPTGDIPPFLVAAEAQRRESIRQQFSGGTSESVVDTLMKQMSNVPQNIQSQPQGDQQAEQSGIGALEDSQQMRRGGPVRRFYTGSLVASVTPRVQEIADQFGVSVDQAAEMIRNNPSLSGDAAATPGRPFRVTEENREARATPFNPMIPAITASPEQVSAADREAARNAKYEEMYTYGGYGSPRPESNGSLSDVSKYNITTPDIPIKPRDETEGTRDSSYENQKKSEESSYRNRIEELFATQEPSNWEEAQKWFAMSQQIMNPDASLLEGLVNAGGVYAQAEGEEARARRADERELQKALLQYDLGERDYERQTAAQGQSNTLEAMKYRAGAAREDAKLYRQAADDTSDKLNRYINSLIQSGVPQEDIAKDPTVQALQTKIDEANQRMKDALVMSQGFDTVFGNMYKLPAGFEASDGDSLFNIGG